MTTPSRKNTPATPAEKIATVALYFCALVLLVQLGIRPLVMWLA